MSHFLKYLHACTWGRDIQLLNVGMTTPTCISPVGFVLIFVVGTGGLLLITTIFSLTALLLGVPTDVSMAIFSCHYIMLWLMRTPYLNGKEGLVSRQRCASLTVTKATGTKAGLNFTLGSCVRIQSDRISHPLRKFIVGHGSVWLITETNHCCDR